MPFSFKDFFRKAGRRGRPANEPHRDTLAWPNLNSLGQSSPAADRIVYKPVPKNLRVLLPHAHRSPRHQLDQEPHRAA